MSAVRAALKISRHHWRSRWLVLPNWKLLHRVSSIQWEDPEDMIHGDGETVCGRRGHLMMPGIFSRMGLKRCPRCCKAMGIPDGEGAPFNAGIKEPGERWPKAAGVAAGEQGLA